MGPGTRATPHTLVFEPWPPYFWKKMKIILLIYTMEQKERMVAKSY